MDTGCAGIARKGCTKITSSIVHGIEHRWPRSIIFNRSRCLCYHSSPAHLSCCTLSIIMRPLNLSIRLGYLPKYLMSCTFEECYLLYLDVWAQNHIRICSIFNHLCPGARPFYEDGHGGGQRKRNEHHT